MAAKPKKQKQTSKSQPERFREAARELGVDDDKSAQTFERTFSKLVPPTRPEKKDG
jgi:hypothetical protein